MGELFEGEDNIRNLFSRMLGSNVTIKDNLKETEEGVFCLFVQSLETVKLNEDKALEAGIDVHSLVDPLWIIIENLLKMEYGTDTTELIMWYLYDRFGPDGKVISMVDENNGKKYTLKTPKDLFNFLKYRSLNK